MAKSIDISKLADEIMSGLEDYVDTTTDGVKSAVRKAGSTVKKEIKANAPKKTGAYSKSWRVTKAKETSNSLELTVHSKTKYQMAHLLEYGHAKRGGGRTAANPHIKPAEEEGIKELERNIKKAIGG